MTRYAYSIELIIQHRNRCSHLGVRQRATTPTAGLIVKPWRRVSIYANYSEGLAQVRKPASCSQRWRGISAIRLKAIRSGCQDGLGRLATTLAVYQIKQQSAFINPATNMFGANGEERHRGWSYWLWRSECQSAAWRISYIDAELTKTQGGVNQGTPYSCSNSP